MPAKNFIKDNFVLIVGLTLPVLLMFGFMLAAHMPQALSDPPKYDLVFAVTEYPSYSGTIPISVKLYIKDGVLKAQYTKNPSQPSGYTGSNIWKKLYLYDASAKTVKELPFPYPADMDKIDSLREETLEATKGMKLDTTTQAPDGYALTTDSYSHSGLFGDIFGGGSYSNEPVLQKGTSRVKLSDSRTNFNYMNPEFVGWVTGKN
jgi:hypothetical protein